MNSLDHQVAIALTALAAALVKQPGIDGAKLRYDFLEILEGIATSPEAVELVGRQIASLMDVVLESERNKPRPAG